MSTHEQFVLLLPMANAYFVLHICYMLTGSQEQHLRVRAQVCDYIDRNGRGLGISEAYVANSGMRKDGTWGIELVVLASLLHSNIFVYSTAGTTDGRSRWFKFSLCSLITQMPIISNPWSMCDE